MLRATSLLAVLFLAFAAAPPVVAKDKISIAMDAYYAQLGRLCPQRHLKWVSPSDMLEAADHYRHALPRSERRRMQSIVGWNAGTDSAKPCLGRDGAMCDAVHEISGFHQISRTPDFARFVCRSFLKCTEQSTCKANPRGRLAYIG